MALLEPEHLCAGAEPETKIGDNRRGMQPAAGRRRRDHVAALSTMSKCTVSPGTAPIFSRWRAFTAMASGNGLRRRPRDVANRGLPAPFDPTARGPIREANAHRLAEARDATGTEFEGSLIGDEFHTRVIVRVGQQNIDRHIDEFRIAIERVAIREGELCALHLTVDEVRPGRIETSKPRLFSSASCCNVTRPSSRSCLQHGIAAVVVGDRRLDRGLPFRHVVGREHAAVGLPEVSITSWVRQNLSTASATKPLLQTSRARSISASRFPPLARLAQDALVGVGHLRIGELVPGCGTLPPGR